MSVAPFAFLEKPTPSPTSSPKQEKTPEPDPNLPVLQQLQGQVGLLDHLVRSTAAYHDERLRMVILIMWLLVALNVILAICLWCCSGKTPSAPPYSPAQVPPYWMPPYPRP
jgi:hypothetical protein